MPLGDLGVSMLVVVRRRARPGQEEALVAAMTAEVYGSRPPRSSRARVFQGLNDPRAALYVAEWSSREAFLTHNSTPLVALDALCTSPPRRWFCQALDVYEVGLTPPRVLACSTFAAPLAAAARLIDYLLEQAGPLLYQQPGCVLRALYQDVDRPGRLISLKGWRSDEDLEAAMLTLSPGLDSHIRGLGASVDHFAGRLRAEIDRSASADLPG